MFGNLFGKKDAAPAASNGINILPKETLENAKISILPKEKLDNMDIILVIDRSGSTGMSKSKRVRGDLLTEIKHDALKVAQLAEQHDDDGITLITFANDVVVHDGIDSSKVESVFARTRADGGTNLAAALKEAVKKARSSSKKEIVILVYTDGEPSGGEAGEQAAFDVLNAAGHEFGRPRIGFTFVQVGQAPGAFKFLNKLNTGLDVDIVACLSSSDAESVDIKNLIWLAQNA